MGKLDKEAVTIYGIIGLYFIGDLYYSFMMVGHITIPETSYEEQVSRIAYITYWTSILWLELQFVKPKCKTKPSIKSMAWLLGLTVFKVLRNILLNPWTFWGINVVVAICLYLYITYESNQFKKAR